jgi:uroporphyrinogen-III synthase
MPDPVVITRPLAQAGPLATRVAALGREVVVLPLLEIAALDHASHAAVPLAAALARLEQFALIAFVSPNAIDAAFSHPALARFSPGKDGKPADSWPHAVALAVLGEGSRQALAAHGITAANATIVSPPDPAQSDSEHLLASMDLAALCGRRVLIVRGESGRELMGEGLRAAGADVTVVAAYRRSVPMLTPALAAQLENVLASPHDWIVTSSEALRGLVGLLQQTEQQLREQGRADSQMVVKLQQQHLIVPHERIAQTAAALGFARLTLTGSGDERLLAALQSQP